jgi:hypothetical protein
MHAQVRITIACPTHAERSDAGRCTNCRLVEQFEQEKKTLDARREALLEKVRAAAAAKAIKLTEIR